MEQEDKQENKKLKGAPEQSSTEDRCAKVYFVCGACGNEIPANRRAFKINTLDAKTWCGRCKKSLMAKSYKCQCGVPWYKCNAHQAVKATVEGDQDSLSSKVEKKLPEKPKAKTVKSKARGVEQEDLEGNYRVPKRRKQKVCEPVFRVSMLSAGLKRKFASLCQDGEEQARRFKHFGSALR